MTTDGFLTDQAFATVFFIYYVLDLLCDNEIHSWLLKFLAVVSEK